MRQELCPARSRTMDEFVSELRKLKMRAGNPSISVITRRVHQAWQAAGRPRTEWPARSTVGNCFLFGRRRPNSDLLLAVVSALVDGDPAAVSAWRTELWAVLGESEAGGQVVAHERLPELPHGPRPLCDPIVDTGQRPTLHQTLVLHGMPGIGKTHRALGLAHAFLAKAPRGTQVLYADLKGSDPAAAAIEPKAVLESFLRLLGAPADRIPHSPTGRHLLYRRLLASTNAVVLLDDAADTEQVRPLLTPSRAGLTLVTARQALPGLDRTPQVHVPALGAAEAVALLRSTAGDDRVSEDVDAAAQMARLLGHHPLALTIIGRHLRDHPRWQLSDYHPEPLLLLALEGGVRAAISACDASLPEPARRLLRLLSVHSDHVLEEAAVAALADLDTTAGRDQLDTLAQAHLVDRAAGGRYVMHPLVRAYAWERIGIDEPASSIRRAMERLAAYRACTNGPDEPSHALLPEPDQAGRPGSGWHRSAMTAFWRPLAAAAV